MGAGLLLPLLLRLAELIPAEDGLDGDLCAAILCLAGAFGTDLIADVDDDLLIVPAFLTVGVLTTGLLDTVETDLGAIALF